MDINEEISLRETICNCLEQQLCEFELLKSMYPEEHEIILLSGNILDEIKDFINCKSEHIPNHLDFVVHLNINNIKLEISVDLPSVYPLEEPDIYVRCNQFNRQQETMLNNKLSDYIRSNYTEGEVCIYTAISWLQDNTDLFYSINKNHSSKKEESKEATECDEFCRYWIHSHHIYNRKKREEILKRAKDLQLTGFCLPGKPGVICIEGSNSYCKEWWNDIKSMNWKKIAIRKIETFDLNEQEDQQKFNKFEELVFKSSGTRNTNKHADLSMFSKFMEGHGLNHVFNDIFGLEGDL